MNKLKVPVLLVILGFFVTACLGGGTDNTVIPKKEYDNGSLNGFVTLPQGCSDPCNSVYSEFHLSEEFAKISGLVCTTDFHDPLKPGAEAITQATHSYANPGEYDVEHLCIQKLGDDIESSVSVIIHVTVPPQLAPVSEDIQTGGQ